MGVRFPPFPDRHEEHPAMIEVETVPHLEPPGTTLATYANREAWLDARRQYIGASDAAVVLGLSKWKSPLALYYEKINELPAPTAEEDARAAERREWGLLLEEPIAQRYAALTQRLVGAPAPFSMLVSKKHKFATASIDRWVCGLGADAVPPPNKLPAIAPLQIKMAGTWVSDEWEDEAGEIQIPLVYQIQVQHEMMVTGAKWGSIAVLIGGNELRWSDLLRDDAIITVIADKEKEFAAHVAARQPPPADGHEATRAILKALHPKDDGTTIDLTGASGTFLRYHRELERVNDQIAELAAEKDKLRNLLIQAIGPHTFADLGKGVRYSYKWQSRKAYTVNATEFRSLRQVGK